MKRYVVALSVAGSDPSGGAGIQADLKTFAALGVYGAAAITAVTVQNTMGVQYVHALPPQVVYDQIVAVMEDLQPDAVKLGMVNDMATLEAIVEALTAFPPKCLVVDPIILSSNGKMLMTPEALTLMKKRLFPITDLLTPNLPETATLIGSALDAQIDVKEAADKILSYGVGAVLVKGGHANGDCKKDRLFYKADDGVLLREFSAPAVVSRNTHGTGCTLSSAITAYMACGKDLVSAVDEAKQYISKALATGADLIVGKGTGSLNHFFEPRKAIIEDKEP